MQLNRFKFIIDKLLKQYPKIKTFTIAYSGGLDSQVLLYALAQLKPNVSIKAIHIHHGLQNEADQWVLHCQTQCQQLNIKLEIKYLQLQFDRGESIEAVARNQRYQSLFASLNTDTALLTAHHQDDQAETVLLQLLRGAGVAGLAAMPVDAYYQDYLILRPLLRYTRQQLAEYANYHQLQWVEDPSNQSSQFRRNFIRHQVMPLLTNYYPSASKTIARVADNCANANQLLTEIAIQDLSIVQVSQHNSLTIAITPLQTLSINRQYNVLRYWYWQQTQLILDKQHLEQIISQVICANKNSIPSMSWQQWVVSRYQQHLYVYPKLPAIPQAQSWDFSQALVLDKLGILQARLTKGQGLSKTITKVRVKFRQGGERFHQAGRAYPRALKKILQTEGILPWQRNYLPLLMVDNTIVAVADFWIAEGYQAKSGECAWLLQWQPF